MGGYRLDRSPRGGFDEIPDSQVWDTRLPESFRTVSDFRTFWIAVCDSERHAREPHRSCQGAASVRPGSASSSCSRGGEERWQAGEGRVELSEPELPRRVAVDQRGREPLRLRAVRSYRVAGERVVALWILTLLDEPLAGVGGERCSSPRLNCMAIHRLHNAAPSSAGFLPEIFWIFFRRSCSAFAGPGRRRTRSSTGGSPPGYGRRAGGGRARARAGRRRDTAGLRATLDLAGRPSVGAELRVGSRQAERELEGVVELLGLGRAQRDELRLEERPGDRHEVVGVDDAPPRQAVARSEQDLAGMPRITVETSATVTERRMA